MSRLALLLAVLVPGMPAFAYEEMYPQTPPGVVEVKTIPSVRALEAQGRGTYFESDDGTFMRLFRYIDRNRVAMTVPVEADVEANRMRFFAGRDASGRELPEDEAVRVVTLPERRVVSAGLRGSYSRERFEEGLKLAQAWLAENPGWVQEGEPHAVFWNGPYVPGFLKRSEVHVPVVPAGDPPRE